MGVPEIAYKFLPPEFALRAIQSHRIKVSMLTGLNDIYDCAPISGPLPSDPRYAHHTVPDEMVKGYQRSYGIISFSKSIASPLLWGHYAANATGMALGFDIGRMRLGVRLDVDYQHERPEVKIPDEPRVMHGFTREELKGAFAIKAEDWKYEKEVRFMLPLCECMPDDRGLYFAGFHLVELKEVVRGYHCSIPEQFIYDLSRNSRLDLKVFNSKQNPKHFAVDTEFVPFRPPPQMPLPSQ
jgi:hypothetical protein